MFNNFLTTAGPEMLPSPSPPPPPKSFSATFSEFRLWYLVVYSLMMGAGRALGGTACLLSGDD